MRSKSMSLDCLQPTKCTSAFGTLRWKRRTIPKVRVAAGSFSLGQIRDAEKAPPNWTMKLTSEPHTLGGQHTRRSLGRRDPERSVDCQAERAEPMVELEDIARRELSLRDRVA